MKQFKYKLTIISFLILVLLTTTTQAFGATFKAAVLVETNTGEILYQYEKDKILPQASLTKLMTFYTFMQLAQAKKIDLDKQITIDVSSFQIPWYGSQIKLKKGDVLSINDLLKSLLVVSANDSAEALKRIYNSYGLNMIADMNRQSQELGLTNSKFINVSGLTENKEKTAVKKYNVTTAGELAKLSCLILEKYPDIIKITAKRKLTVNKKTYNSTNKLLLQYHNIDGFKTGSTEEAGYCVAATENVTAQIGQGKDTRLFAVVLGCDTDIQRFREAKRLLDYGSTHYVNYKVLSKDKTIRIDNEYFKNGFINCVVKEDTHLLVRNDQVPKKVIQFTNKLNSDLGKGEKIGSITASVSVPGMSEKSITQEIYTAESYKRKALPQRILISIKNFFKGLF